MADDDDTPDDAVARRKAAKAVYAKRWRDKNPDYHKNYRAEHGRKPPPKPDAETKARRRARDAAWQKQYRAANREKFTAANQSWRERNPNYNQEHRAKDPEKLRKRNALWASNNPDLVLAKAHRRLARKRAAEGSFTPDDMAEIRERQQDCCAACGCELCCGGEIDHIIPLSRNGTNWPSNLQWLCRSCNRRKSSRTMDEFILLRGGRRG